MRTDQNANLAEVDLLYYSHALKRRGLFDIVETDMTKLVNEQCRDQAMHWLKLGNFIMAMRWYNTARVRTIGHKKSDVYEAAAAECAKQAGALFDRNLFAEDWEAVAEPAY